MVKYFCGIHRVCLNKGVRHGKGVACFLVWCSAYSLPRHCAFSGRLWGKLLMYNTILHNIGGCYTVVTLTLVGCLLRVGMYKGFNTMSSKNKGSNKSNATTQDTQDTQPTIITVAKALLAVAGMLPAATVTIGSNVLPNPLHLPHGASKRAMALAVYNAVSGMGYGDAETKRLSGVLLVVTGVGYCHATGKVLIGEVKGKRGLVGYIKPNAAWWTTTSNVAKAQLVQAYANTIVKGCIGEATDYATACNMADTVMGKYVTKYGDDTVDLS